MALQHTKAYRADYIWQAPDDDQRYEVIDGVLYVGATPSIKHQLVSTALTAILYVHVRAHGAGRVLSAPVGVVLDPFTGVEPDIVYVSREREHLLSGRGVEGSPDLVVEVLSPSTRMIDRGLKMQHYARAGIPHYWIVDPLALTLEAYELSEGSYSLVGEYRDDDQFAPAVLPGLTIPLAQLWE